jgi:hypothetical protein
MRSTLLAFALGVVLLAASASAPASPLEAPTLRVGVGPQLTLVGVGFPPRARLSVRVDGPGLTRRASVRASSRGRFVLRFAGLERCSIDRATAITPSGARVRVPTAWFVRECPPPPPLAPGIYAVG